MREGRPAVRLGLASLAAGLLCNVWAVETLLGLRGGVPLYAAQAVLVAAGLFLLLVRPRLGRPARVATAVLGVAAAAGAAGTGLGAFGSADRVEELLAIRDSELVIEELTPGLQGLARDLLDGAWPESTDLFRDTVEVVDLAPAPGPPRDLCGGRVRERAWAPADAPARRPATALALWRPLRELAPAFEHASFSFPEGRLRGEDEFASVLGFEGLGRRPDGSLVHASGTVAVDWERTGDRWRIASWRTLRMRLHEATHALFEDVLDRAVDDVAAVRACRHEELTVAVLTGAAEEPPHFSIVSVGAGHPSVAVVDLDRDGWDDLYVTRPWSPNLFLRNRGDATFETAPLPGALDLGDYAASALFADFDNDGDADLFVGRTYDRALLLANEGGRFVPRDPGVVLPYFVTSLAAADFDGDGLLDVYLSTYAAAEVERALIYGRPVLAGYLPEAEEKEIARRAPYSERYVDRVGPPNVLLRNAGGGRFVPVAGLETWRNTFQSTWGDYDGDGDPDLYCANDYAPNNLFRNEGGGVFTDVTAETGTEDVGFGMGASWGDYDNDGRQDLYVTNMYSKAGRRITAQIEAPDPRNVRAARGNTLFRNEGARFAHVSGTEPPRLLVEKAGWGWGGTFGDLDNDGWLDIFTLAGFYTAPQEVAIPLDT